MNENRLSPSGEESGGVELKTRDIVQFGVNVNVDKKGECDGVKGQHTFSHVINRVLVCMHCHLDSGGHACRTGAWISVVRQTFL